MLDLAERAEIAGRLRFAPYDAGPGIAPSRACLGSAGDSVMLEATAYRAMSR